MATPAVQELNSIPLEHMIGGPMRAIVNAQTMASLATIDYIQSVGLDSNGDVRNVSFTISKSDPLNPGTLVPSTIIAPLLVLAPPPSIRVAEATISFKAKLTDIQTTDRSVAIAMKTEFGLNAKIVTVKASTSVQIDAKSSSRREREYSLDVNVKIVEDAIPAGLAKLLDILEKLI